MEQPQHHVIETDEGRFDVVFQLLEEAKSDDAAAAEIEGEVARSEAEAIDELRRLSAEFAETPTVSYTST